MSGVMGGKILDPKTMDRLTDKGKEAQRRRQEAVDRRLKEDQTKKLSQDAATVAQQRRGGGF